MLFCFNTIGVLTSGAAGISNGLEFVFDLAEWGIGLLALVSLWDRRAKAYFAETSRAWSVAMPGWRKKRAATGRPAAR